jgi:hypothetical protein
MPTSPLLTDEYLEYYMEGDYWWPGGPGAAPAKPKPAADVPVVTASGSGLAVTAAADTSSSSAATSDTTISSASYVTSSPASATVTTVTTTTTTTTMASVSGDAVQATGHAAGSGSSSAASRITLVPCDDAGLQDYYQLYAYDGTDYTEIEDPATAIEAAEARERTAIDMKVAAIQKELNDHGAAGSVEAQDGKAKKLGAVRKVGQNSKARSRGGSS